MGISLTPLASLCLGVVRGWINVARRGRGGQIDDQGTAWTRLPAEQLRDQLAREFLVEVSTRSVQRALKELEEQNQIRREQRWKHRYKRDYWYAIPEQEEALEALSPRAIAGKFRSERTRQRTRTETTAPTHQVLHTPLSNPHFSKTDSQKDVGKKQRTVPTPTESETARTRKDSHLFAVAACMEYAKRPPAQGFGALTTYQDDENERQSRRNEGKLMREVWVGGVCHRVADDPLTAPTN
jgi:hypothetical protein